MKPAADTLLQAVPGLPPALVEEHLQRLDSEYFEVFNTAAIAGHLQRLHGLSRDRPVALELQEADGGLDITVLAYDYPALFSLITGVLSGLGLSIESGDVFTWRSGGSERRRIIDRFRCTASGIPVEALAARCLEILGPVVALLEEQTADARREARRRVNELVIEQLSREGPPSRGALLPVDIAVHNDQRTTRLEITSQDTPAFLYAISTALALQQASIERVRIRTRAGRIEDVIDLVDPRGKPFEGAAAHNRLRLAVLLTKQFTYYLDRAPAPYDALQRFESLAQDLVSAPGGDAWVEQLSEPRTLQALARLLGASDFLWEDFIRLQYEHLLPLLRTAERRFSHTPKALRAAWERTLSAATTDEERWQALNAFKDREIFLIDLDHILDPEADFRTLSAALTALAELVVNGAYDLARAALTERHGVPRTVAGMEAPCAVFGLGKFGGGALGYASDIEVLFLYGDHGRTDGAQPIDNAEFFARLARAAAAGIRAKREGIFEVDLRLRPDGESGPLACSLERFCRYYGPGGRAHSYERLALVRLRAIGGDRELGARVERLRDELLYAAPSIDLQALRALREQQFKEKNEPGRSNAKFSPGGLVDLEYAVQILQVSYGGSFPALRTPQLHTALDGLMEAGLLDAAECRRLAEAYNFLRRLINGLRMLRGSANDLFLPPEDSDEYRHLARRMGYAPQHVLGPARALRLDYETHTAAVRTFVESRFGARAIPGSGEGSLADLTLSEQVDQEKAGRLLGRLGFAEPRRALLNLRRLAGAGSQREPFARLGLLAADILRGEPDPDMALNQWERFVEKLPDAARHYQEFLDQPRRLEILLALFARSRFLGETLIRNPDFLDWATQPAILERPRVSNELAAELRAGDTTGDGPSRQRAVRLFRRREMLRIGVRDICLEAPLEEVTADLSALAEALVQVALEHAGEGIDPPPPPLCILALGKLGGEELNYSSDIDLLAVCADHGPAPEERAAQVLRRLRELLSKHTVDGYVYRVDLRLRPHGSAGSLVNTLPRLAAYYHREASLWEWQALLKCRPIAGDATLGQRFMDDIAALITARHDPQQVVASIRALRATAIAQLPDDGIDVKNGAGGLRDIEFLVQGLQLIHIARHPGLRQANTLQALAALAAAGLLSADEHGGLRHDYLLLRRIEHFLQILEDRQVHRLPQDPRETQALARRVKNRRDADPQAFTAEVTQAMAGVRARFDRLLEG